MKTNFFKLLSSLLTFSMLTAVYSCSQDTKSGSEGGVAVKIKASKF